ncbi:MAG: VPLPA-CTERM sorting domain-containing protein [Pikeienuella sp.]
MMKIVVAAVAALVSFAGSASAASLIPVGNTTTEGNAGNVIPFNTRFVPQQYQQIWDASVFGTDPLTITAISFRVEGIFEDFPGGPTELVLGFTTTSAEVDGLSNTLADNIGTPLVTVAQNPVMGSASGGALPNGEPNPFGATITFDTPYEYDPANGNLLMDVSILSEVGPSGFDAVDTVGDATSRAVTSPLGVTNDSVGLVVAFEVSEGGGAVVPLPAGIWLSLTALVGLGMIGRRRTGPTFA